MADHLSNHLSNCSCVGQIRTSKTKPFVFMYQDKVVKGPYTKGSKRLTRVKEITNLPYHPPCLVTPASIEKEYLTYPNLAFTWDSYSYKESFSTYEYRVMKDSDLKSSTLEDLEGKDLTDLLETWVVLWILKVGDVNLRNTLYSTSTNEFYIVDIDDTSSKDRDHMVWFFNRNPANSSTLLKLIQPFIGRVIDRLETLPYGSNRRVEAIERLKKMKDDEVLEDPMSNLETGPLGKMVWKGMRGFGANYTFSGHSFDVMISALQKYIRRSEVEWAVEVAVECWRMGELDPAPRTNLFNRVSIIAVEDVGVASLDRVCKVVDLLSDKKNRTLDNLIKCVVTLADPSTLKTRVMSHLRHAYGWTEKSRRYGLAIDETENNSLLHLFEECVKAKKREMFLWYSRFISSLSSSLSKVPKVPKTKKPGFNSSTTDPRVKLWEVLYPHLDPSVSLPLMKGYWMASEKAPYIMVAMTVLVYQVERIEMDWVFADYGGKVGSILRGDFIIEEIQSYAIDKHTIQGKRLGKTRKDFVMEGAIVIPEDPRFIDELLQEIYRGE